MDVALWMDYREYSGKSPLNEATDDFIIVNFKLHEEFDDFKAMENRLHLNFLHMTELLEYYCMTKCPSILELNVIQKFGKIYLKLSSEQVDKLVEWVYKMRKLYKTKSKEIFTAGGSKVLANGNYDECVYCNNHM